MMKQQLVKFTEPGENIQIGYVQKINQAYFIRVRTDNGRAVWCAINKGLHLFDILDEREREKIKVDDITINFDYRDTPVGPVDFLGWYYNHKAPEEPKEEPKAASTWDYSLNPNYGIF